MAVSLTILDPPILLRNTTHCKMQFVLPLPNAQLDPTNGLPSCKIILMMNKIK